MLGEDPSSTAHRAYRHPRRPTTPKPDKSLIGYLNAWAELLPGLPRALAVSYEAMRADPHGTLGRVAAFIDRPFTEEEIAAAVAFAAFDSLQAKERAGFFPNFRLRPGDVRDSQSYKVRRGRVGGYREDFMPEQAAELDALVAAELDPSFGYGAGTATAQNPGAIVPLRIDSVSSLEDKR
jgi:hypothetical protein